MKVTDILDAINARLVEKWPDWTVYVDVCPVDFARPSFWLAVEKNDWTDANRFLIRHDLQLRLTIYDELDEHYEASWYRLAREADEVMELLTPVLQVGGRHLKLTLKSLPRDPDRAYVQINTSWMDKWPDATGGDTAPVADSYSLAIRADIKGGTSETLFTGDGNTASAAARDSK